MAINLLSDTATSLGSIILCFSTMPILSDEEVRALVAQVKKQQTEIDVLKRLFGRLIMEAGLSEDHYIGIDGQMVSIPMEQPDKGHAMKAHYTAGLLNMMGNEDHVNSGFLAEGDALFNSERPAFLLPEDFFELFGAGARKIGNNITPPPAQTGNSAGDSQASDLVSNNEDSGSSNDKTNAATEATKPSNIN
ncbi:hypothetical protein FGADI_12494 [Fusarium gaditjirri]|uniref:Uncharacterized protein n=1 Tax=Fusarium gaditjirri TaxID=282569 RepID=A0A8H4WP49_9HYPO|nr:hypothetical protein FGADI_12494 [Fusarium gaditjirri]